MGLVHLHWDGDRLAFAAPPCRTTEVAPDDLEAVRSALGLGPADVVDARHLDNGAPWLTLHLTGAGVVLDLEPDHSALARLGEVAVVGPYPPGAAPRSSAFELRAFTGGASITGDPVTGSLNAGVAQWLIGEDRAPTSYVASQGTCIGRAGRIHVEHYGSDTWIRGATHTVVSGTVTL